MEYKRLEQMKAKKSRRKVFLTLALLLFCGIASAQVTIKGNVYGGGRLGDVQNKTVGENTTINNTSVTINNGVIMGSVYGGGKGVETDEKKGLVEGNTNINFLGGTVECSIYGGGELGSVGKFTEYETVTYGDDAGENAGKTVDVPKECATGTGLATVKINGGQVGRVDKAKMPEPGEDDIWGYVFCGGRGEADSITHYKAIALAVVDRTYLEIQNDNTLITASVYGGSENGLVLGNTHVKLLGGQIGVGYYKDEDGIDHWDNIYEPSAWSTAIAAVRNATFDVSYINPFHECDAFPYGAADGNFYVFDSFAGQYDSNGGSVQGSNGHSFLGNLFGGGSGFYPIRPGIWRRSAGRVKGNTTIDIQGGHILTSVYGGNEYTDVIGKSTVNMSAGTVGVPRDLAHITQRPVNSYLYGAGMGDRRTWANTWNNVNEAEVNITGGVVFGSVYGGGEEGHVLGDVKVNIEGSNTLIGTLGYSYLDGNVFGGGRGFSGEALTAGAVGGNIDIDIKDGTILGSVYGGGRMASVGTHFTNPNAGNYGEMQEDGNGKTYGHVTIDISGGTIGNEHESKYQHLAHSYGGNVFGGSMGRLERLNGSTNPLWPKMSKVKSTEVNISEAEGKHTIIRGSVYGGSEFGVVTKDAKVDMSGGTVWFDVYGGGYGSTDLAKKAEYPYQPTGATSPTMVQVTPMQRAGLVEGNSEVSFSGGWIKKSIYGGGELASVGTIVNDTVNAKHTDEEQTFALSWPYEFEYADGTGTATVNISGGRVGLSGKDYLGPWNADGAPYDPTTNALLTPAQIKDAREDNGDVFGGSKGVAGDRYVMAHSANVKETEVNIQYPTTNTATPENYKPDDYVSAFHEKWQDWATYGSLGCLSGALYGGGENGHVITNTNITLDKGLIGHNVYGGGKGSDTYEVTLWHYDEQLQPTTSYLAEVTSITAGKVYGNTNVTMNGGYVVRNVYGGGNRASVGKGNYSGGPGDYQEAGYGEQWTESNAEEMMGYLSASGHTYVNIYGGQVGTVKGDKDDLPTGNIFGGCRGEAAPNAPQTLTPRILYYPQFFLGYVNHTHVTIGQTAKATPDANSPRLYGSVYGGAQDGHVRVGTQVVVNDAEIGNPYVNPTAANTLVGTSDLNHFQWQARGNVYGSGSGLGQYEDASGNHYSYSSGSVTQFTDVIINGGLIHRNVYAGGSLAIVGPPRIRLKYDANHRQTLAKVTVNSAIGVISDVIGGTHTYTVTEGEGDEAQVVEVTENYAYGGQVFGGSRGMLENDEETFSTTIYSEVNLGNGAFVPGNVYGGGEFGQVKQCTKVDMNGGTVGVIDYVRKRNTPTTQPLDSIVHLCGGSVFGGGKGDVSKRNVALVKDSTNVIIRGGHVLHNVYGGGEMASVGLREECLNTSGAPHPTSDFNDYMPKQGTTTHADTTGIAMVTIRGGQVGPAPRMEAGYNIPIGLNGVDGYVYGGGKGIGDSSPTFTNPFGQYKDLADVNNTIVTVDMTNSADTINNRIWGCVFGGGEDGHVLGDAKVYYVNGLMGTFGTSSYDGNIFGGGCNFRRKNQSAGRVRGNILVEMSGGHLYGSIFGGGRLGGTGIDLNGLIVADEGGETGRKYGNITVRVKGGEVGNKKLIENFTKYSMGDVFGGGKGSSLGLDFEGSDPTTALLLSISKNTNVEISQADPDIPTIIYGSVYGGGEVANVGSCTWDMNETTLDISNVTPIPNTGKATVTVSGGRIGVDRMKMRYDIADGEGNYNLKYNNNIGHVFGGGQGIIADPQDNVNNPPVNGGANRLADALAIVFNSDVTIEGGWVKGSVYGGGENGHIWWDTDVKIKGGQIGAGDNGTEDLLYTNAQFFDPIEYFANNAHDDVAPLTSSEAQRALYECNSWPLVKTGEGANRPFDPTYVKAGQYPTDGKTWFGNVFGGGSGYYPYIRKVGDTYEAHWNPNAGKVYGNTNVEITGGHILTSVYGGCEITDVGSYNTDGSLVEGTGTATVKMSGGTLGVPRTLDQIDLHPVTCYLFGAGKGDPRTYFNTKTNVEKAMVEVTGGTIYGSVFGGGEDGHVLDSAIVKIGGNAIIGTTGRSYVDGNIFGGGRGYSGIALTAGVVAGNIKVNISGGTMLGSIYGGGRLASVGTYLVEESDSNYGNLMPDLADDPHGHIQVNISGGTIGNDYEAIYHTNFNQHPVGGNVFAGAMGRIVKLDNVTIDPLWTRQAKVRSTDLNISGTAVIKGNVYGGAEFGTVEQNANIKVSGGEIWRDVYGAGYGSSDATFTTGITNNPMQLAGRVFGNTDIEVSGGWIKKCVYGGGEMASVGTINDSVQHTSAAQLAMSWPYKFVYADNTGKANIEVTGGRLGETGKDYMGPWNADGLAYDPSDGHVLTDAEKKEARVDNGDIYGGGKGIAGAPYWEAHLANVNETEIYIHYDDTCNATPATYKNLKKSCITGAVYGGGENGHVNENTSIKIDNGLVGHAVYGGGKGKDTYTVTHRDTEETLYSLSAGKVFGNTTIEINGGYVVRSVFGGGNMASVGKGNYIGYPIGSATPEETGTSSDGLCKITITGGQLGALTPNKPSDSFKDGIPYGSVFGGCRGAVESESDNLTSNVAHMSFVNNTEVTIGGTARLYGSVYGGGQDGHVRWNTDVTVEGGEIGVAYGNPVTASSTVGVPASNISSTDLIDGEIGFDDENWTQRGNVYGGGSGISTWVDGDDEEHYSLYAGSVMGKADVEIKGGRIHRNVYGGGNLGTIGDNNLETTGDTPTVTVNGTAKVGLSTDIIGSYTVTGGGHDGDTTIYFAYGGNVFGAGRGLQSDDYKNYCNVESTKVTVSAGHVFGDIYGGGEDGHVLGNTDVQIQGGLIGTRGVSGFDGNVFGGGKGSSYPTTTGTGTDAVTTNHLYLTCGRVGGNTKVTMTGGSTKASIFGGGRLALTGVNDDGVFPNNADWVVANHGNTEVNISGGTVGTSDIDSLLVCDYSVGDVFGSGKGDFDYYQMVEAGRVTNTTIKISGDNTVIHGNVVGGGEMASIGWWGDDAKYYAYTGAANVTIEGGSIGSPTELLYTEASNPGHWTMYENGQLIHTCTGNVFGGGQGDVDTISPAWVSMGRAREAMVTINGGTVMSCVYGGGEQGAVTGDTRVLVNNGTVGSFVNTSTTSFYFGGVYGAGYGSDDPNEDNSTYPNDSTAARGTKGWTPAILAGRVYGDSRVDILGGTILGNVYGGCERAYLGYEDSDTKGNALVNIGKKTRGDGYEGNASFGGNSGVFGGNKFAGTPFGNTEVNIYQTAHTVQNTCPPDPTGGWTPELLEANADTMQYAIRYVFGGGDMSDYNPHEGKTALTHVWQCENTIEDLYGGGNAASIGANTNGYYTNVRLVVDGGRMHRVFGGGNGTVTAANIYGRADTYLYGGLIDQAFGGSNNSGTIVLDSLHIEDGPAGCTKFIHEVFGGSSAAADWGDIVAKIECGDTQGISTFYGGSEHAEIIGNLTVNIMGGELDYVFAGSKGTETNPGNIKKYPTLQQIQEAPSGTYPTGLITYLAEQAAQGNNLYGTGGNVTLNLYGGTIRRAAFGGNDFSGRIEGKITVNVIDTVQHCQLYLEDLYGAGRSAAYEPIDPSIVSPEINVIHGTVHGTVYGGGQGASAVVKANPVVNIGYNPSTMANIVAPLAPDFNPAGSEAYVLKNVYGGGNRASVEGNPNVNVMENASTNKTIVGTLNTDGSPVSGTGNIFGGGQGLNTSISYAQVQGSNTVKIKSGKVYGNVFGGGQLASVTGNTLVEVTGGEIGVMTARMNGENPVLHADYGIQMYDLSGGRVYGGGQGDALDKNFGRVQGNTNVNVSGTAKIHNNVYGGGELGSVGNGNLSDKNSGVAKVVVTGGEIGPLDGSGLNAYVYGGGRGRDNEADANNLYKDFANVDSTSVIVSDNARIYGSIFGGGSDGHVLGNVRVLVEKGTGSGDNKPIVGTTGTTSWDGNIFGGGRNYLASNTAAGRVGGNITVEMTDGMLYGSVFGGGRLGGTGVGIDGVDGNYVAPTDKGFITVDISGGQVGRNETGYAYSYNEISGHVFGGGKGIVSDDIQLWPDLGLATGTKVVIRDNARIYGSVYGGGETAPVMRNDSVFIKGGEIGNQYGTVGTDTYAQKGSVFGGGRGSESRSRVNVYQIPAYNMAGRCTGNTYVEIEGGQIHNNVYGGGELASVGDTTNTNYNSTQSGYARVVMTGGQVGTNNVTQTSGNEGNIYGGGLGMTGRDEKHFSNVDRTLVELSDNAYVTSSVFGGSQNGHVLGDANVNVSGGTIGRSLTLRERLVDEKNNHLSIFTGNVYGGGRGADKDASGKYSNKAGHVKGNTNVTVSGGVVRHNVYGGGSLASVGDFIVENGALIGCAPNTGLTTVTITGDDTKHAHIGPTLADLTYTPAGAEVTELSAYFTQVYGTTITFDPAHTVDTAFKYLGGNEGSVYGSSRGLVDEVYFDTMAYINNSLVTVSGTAQVISGVFGGGENGHVLSNTDVRIDGGVIGAVPLHGTATSTEYQITTGPYAGTTVNLKAKDGELIEDEYGAGRRVFRGSVFGGGRGTDTYIDNSYNPPVRFRPKAGLVHGNTKVTITDGTIYNRVYGGGTIASVGSFTYDNVVKDSIVSVAEGTGKAEVIVSGGQIGTDGNNNGDVFGGGLGVAAAPKEQLSYLAYVGETDVTIEGNACVKSSVYGGSSSGHVQGNAKVTVKGNAEIGYLNAGQIHGGWHSSVYGGGGGAERYVIQKGAQQIKHLSISSGRVFGNTDVNIEGGTIHNNVYGGGAIASVGTYKIGDAAPVIAGTGETVVTLTGGTIGSIGTVNDKPVLFGGDVFGSGRGLPDAPNAFMDSLSYAANSIVNVGKKVEGVLSGNVLVNGSVYGSGESGHVFEKATVNVYSGRVGDNTKSAALEVCGNVYGGGSGFDMYDSNNDGEPDSYNPRAGLVHGNTEVNIEGGWVMRSVYGGGEMASVGTLTNDTTQARYQHTDPATTFAYSWPYEFVCAPGTGTTTIYVKGGRIGITGKDADMDNGDIYGGSKGLAKSGKAESPYVLAHFANVDNTIINIQYPESNTATPENYKDETNGVYAHDCITGAVYGGSENGHVNTNTNITLDNGLVGHAIYGGGKGKGKYKGEYSLTAGKVYGNTNITINGGYVVRSVFGGGNLASVGKGNYAGYGEKDDAESWADTLNSGHTYITIKRGQLGMLPVDLTKPESVVKDNIPYGSVFGGCRGQVVAPVAGEHDRFGYVNKTHVTIGEAGTTGPRLYGSVYGGGQDGHVRWNTDITVNSGEIGVPYVSAEDALATVGSEKIDTLYWTARGNVFGGGSGLGTYEIEEGGELVQRYNLEAGSVTEKTHVTINGGTIHRDVYGGGNISSVGLDLLDGATSLCTVDVKNGTIGVVEDMANQYGGNVYGSSRGEIAVRDAIFNDMATVKAALVNIGVENATTGPLVNASVYGSGENGHVSTNATVNICSGRVGDASNETIQADEHCGNVYGSGKGTDINADNEYNPVSGIVLGNSFVNVKGGWVMRSVYGGGEMASVGTISNAVKHETDYALSWPYEFTYADGTGTATIKVTGGRIGITGKDADMDNGDIYGGSKGMAGEDYAMAFYANVKETVITIQYPEDNTATPENYKEKDSNDNYAHDCITGAVYGGSENGHVNASTNITLHKGLVGHAVYGGGKGKGKYTPAGSEELVYSLTAGKVYGNTNITINGGYVVRSVFGGGNLASVGKGNYLGYGETGSQDVANASGHTYVTVKGGQLGMLNPANPDKAFKDNIPYGSVFGGCRGEVVANPDDRFGYVNNTHVVIGSPTTSPRLYGSVYGGAQDGHVRWNTNVDVKNGKIGVVFGEDVVANDNTINSDPNSVHWTARGNVLGGGSGLGTYETVVGEEAVQLHNPVAGSVTCNTLVAINGGEVCRDIFGGGNMSSVGKAEPITAEAEQGHTRVFVNDGLVRGSVYGGGTQSMVYKERVVTITDGTVKGNVYGGSDNLANGVEAFTSLKTVNVRGGHVEGSVFGGSHNANEGDNAMLWTGFVNISGGTIDQDVFAAGNGGAVTGSLCVNIGKEAISNAPTYVEFSDPTSGSANMFYNVMDDGTSTFVPVASKLIIRGDVYGGSHHYGNLEDEHWNQYDVAGFSVVFADGTGYNTISNDESTDAYMYIGRGYYGSGKHCESGRIGRGIVIRNYGGRTDDDEHHNELVQATRTLNTIQHGGIVVLDHTNLNMTGARSISMPDNETQYGVVKADLGLYVINGSGIVLGAENNPAYMDSIKVVKSMYLKDGETSYNNVIGHNAQDTWETVGIIGDTPETAKLYRLHHTGTADSPSITPDENPLTPDQENVIIFNDESKLWVRYHDKKEGDAQPRQYYGELQGFFRMRGDDYDPKGTESFAFARPKITNSTPKDNDSDGGFLSYDATNCNYFTDYGAQYTETKQYPYTNVLYDRGDRTEYRMWVGPDRNAAHWYVDGRDNGWGRDDMTKKVNQAGLYPDKPKKTLFGVNGTAGTGIVSETYDASTEDDLYNYSYEKDQIYVVGALSEFDEAVLKDSRYFDEETPVLPLRLYRYPGGHAMSNGLLDNGNGSAPASAEAWANGATGSQGPGANYGAMLEVKDNTEISLQGVVLDGLYGFVDEDVTLHQIPASFDQTKVDKPLVVTRKESKLNLSDSTVLKRGYNKTDAAAWYTDPDYKSYTSDGAIYNGAALFVDSTATVNVSGELYITGNVQKKGEGTIMSNVYLPTFNSHLYVNGALHDDTRIGVTSPRRNKKASYLDNTLSPVAEVTVGEGAAIIAKNAWMKDNFVDDQDWFFGNGNHSTYYQMTETKSDNTKTLSFGWTWANVVRTQPTGFSYDDIDSPEDMAWLISQSVGMNGETATNFSGTAIKQTKDIDLGQYVWVPVGDSIIGSTDHLPFKGSYDGQGHLISKLSVAFIGKGDHRYERQQYGMFGYVKKGNVNRTFLVNSYVAPEISLNTSDDILNIGGLIGCLEDATVSNSEAAVSIVCPDKIGDNIVAGGLVAKMVSGEIHSSMAMPWINTRNASSGPVGGLVGSAVAGKIYNSFVNGEFSLNGTPKVGGLLGSNMGADMQNCYVNWGGSTTPSSTLFKSIVNNAVSDARIKYCYDKKDAIEAGVNGKLIKEFTPTGSSDMLGYMYKDNVVGAGADSTLFKQLNRWVDSTNRANHNYAYARWARPGLAEINGDLPVLMLNEFDVVSGGVPVSHQGSFRSVGTYADTKALQYGGPVRDGNELDAALTRTLQKDSEDHVLPEYLFVYGDVNNVGSNLTINRSKVSIHEDAAITTPGSLNAFANSYVGVTFDNSHEGGATSTPGMNFMGEQQLPRDWHMFSSPLSNAPLGFDYKGDNDANSSHFNNPWVSIENEFNWLHGARYWMFGWDNSLSQTSATAEVNSDWQDGYFPSQTLRNAAGTAYDFGYGCIENSNEDGHYPYGMDLYTWTEPDYHWINFKRNGPNHWHTDDHQGIHDQINYEPVYGAPAKVNEENLVVGRGYMGAIATETFMQSHGTLNAGEKSIMLTSTTSSLIRGWNLVGNPYHGYLDFDKVGDPDGVNKDVLSHHITADETDEGAFYVIYDADRFTGDAASAFRYYPVSGSEGGDYADRFLHPHQGFYVKANEGGGLLKFRENMLVNRKDIEVAGGSGSFREERPAYPLVNLYLNSDQGCADVTVIEFERPEWGGARKLKELRVGDGLFYAHHEGGYYAALFAQEGVDRVPLWFEAKENDIFTMKWNLANADFHSMYLIDNIAGVEYDMLKNNTYSFEGHTDDYPSRFLIVFDLTGLEEQDDEEEHNFAFFDGSEWVVTGDGDLQFIDALGQVLAEKHISGQSRIFLPQVADGPYLFRLINGKETKIQKVIITK